MRSIVVHADIGAPNRVATHTLSDGTVRRFRPVGACFIIDNKGGLHAGGEAVMPRATETRERENPIVERIGGTREGTGLSARIFIGLSVGDTPTYTIDDVVKATVAIRKRQGSLPDASFLAQRGVYTQAGSTVEENSVQIIIIDMQGDTKQVFTSQVVELAKELREDFKQESVIVEVQKRGVVVDVFSVTAEWYEEGHKAP